MIQSHRFSRTQKTNRRSKSRRVDHSLVQMELLETRQLLTVLLADSFEQAEWNGNWIEDGQNDWARTTQRAANGSYSAEVDGSATNATLTIANPLDLTSYGSAELTFSWYIESSFDSGEYIALDLYDGSSWTEVASLQGNVDQENVWHNEMITIDGNYLVTDFQARFRAKVSSSREDGFVDNVQIEGTLASSPEISISDATAIEGGSTWGFADAIALDGGGISGWPWGVAKGSNGDLFVSYSQVIANGEVEARIEKIDSVTGEVEHDFIPLGTSGLFKAKELEIHDGWIYVANKGTNEILRFDESTGTPDPAGPFVSSGSGGLIGARGMVFDAAGDLLVSSKGTDEILKFSGTDGSFLSVFAPSVTAGGTGPKDLALDAAGSVLYVAGNDRIYKYSMVDGTPVGVIASNAMTDPAGVEFGPDGDLYTTNASTDQVLQFDGQTGALISAIDVDASYGEPIGLAFDDAGSLYIAAHLTTGELLRYTPSSSAVFTVSLSSLSANPVSVAFATTNATATSGSDYTATSGTLVFQPGVTTRRIIVPTIDDLDIESDETFSVTLSNGSGATIGDAIGIGTIVDDEVVVSGTKFYVVDDTVDDMFEYEADGTSVENYNLGSGNNAPRGVAADITGNTVWVIDNDDYVYVHDNAGNLLRSWKASGLDRPEGIATDGTDVWIVDRGNDRVHYFAGGATRTGNTGATSSFALAAGNSRGITTDGAYLWVVDAGTDDVYKYTVGGTLVGSWALDSRNSSPQGITIDPANVNDVWVIDSGDDAIYQYSGAASRTSGSQSADVVLGLASGNTNPKGIADPPVPTILQKAAPPAPVTDYGWSTLIPAPTRNSGNSLSRVNGITEPAARQRTESPRTVAEWIRLTDRDQEQDDAETTVVSATGITPGRASTPVVNTQLESQTSDFDNWLDVIAEDLLEMLS